MTNEKTLAKTEVEQMRQAARLYANVFGDVANELDGLMREYDKLSSDEIKERVVVIRKQIQELPE